MKDEVSRETRWCIQCGAAFDVVRLDPAPVFPLRCCACELVTEVVRGPVFVYEDVNAPNAEGT